MADQYNKSKMISEIKNHLLDKINIFNAKRTINKIKCGGPKSISDEKM